MDRTTEGASTLIILARDQATFYEFLKARQEGKGPTVVILDRRTGERRVDGQPPDDDRRQSNRRAPTPEAALALMSVLGFMILHREGDQWVP
ncbi:MAG TPA: hypothetical protein VGW35_09425 [Methylomirabilota bacterium]|nr:hypothetical protein [Methylomirabilota bacterium]